MGCSGCHVNELFFEIKMEGEQNSGLLPDIRLHLNRKKALTDARENILVIKESAMADFLHFCNDHMNQSEVYFRVGENGWEPVSEIHRILESHWIDDVIKNEMITCLCQPIVNKDLEIIAYEILSRFKKADGTTVYPNEVFAAAKVRGRLYALDKLCRMTAVRFAAILQKKAFINFIPTSIYSPEFCLKSTIATAEQLGVDPSNFIFEVVETEHVEDIEHLKRILSYYKEKGFQYALDDVGEGYSTLELLEQLKPQYMKLDMKYVQGVATKEEKQKIANQFLAAAIQIGSIPLAEGVETEQDFEWLKTAGYQLFQGYLFGRPGTVTGTVRGQSEVLSILNGH